MEDSVCMGKKMDGRPCGRPVQSGQLFCRGHRSQIAELEKIQCPKGCGELSYSTFDEIGYYECRKCKGSLLNAKEIEEQVYLLLNFGEVKTDSGRRIRIRADSLCVHGDNPDGVRIIRRLREIIDNA